MKTLPSKAKISGLTLVEVLVVIVIVAVLVAMLLPARVHSGRAPQTACQQNLKQIDISFLIYADDNSGKFPMQVSVTNGGTREFIFSGHAFQHFQKMKDYIHDPRYLICPSDTNRQAAVSFEALSNLNISYFLNADCSPTNNPTQFLLAGDRNLTLNRLPVKSGLLVATTNQNVDWSAEVHLRGGNLAFADGHIEWNRTGGFKAIIQEQPLATNRLCIP